MNVFVSPLAAAGRIPFFLDADDNPDFQHNLIITFWPITMFLEICMQNNSVIFALSRQINKQKVCEGNQPSLRR